MWNKKNIDWLSKVKTFGDKTLLFLNNIKDFEKLVAALRAGLKAFYDELNKPDEEQA